MIVFIDFNFTQLVYFDQEYDICVGNQNCRDYSLCHYVYGWKIKWLKMQAGEIIFPRKRRHRQNRVINSPSLDREDSVGN